MQKLSILICLTVILGSCQTDDSPYSYLSDPDTVTDMVQLKLNVADNSIPLNCILQANEMFIEWGDSSKPTDFVFRGSADSIEAIKAVSHSYTSTGDYDISVKALKLRNIRLTNTDKNDFSELKLYNCSSLLKLYCENQPITELDLSDCPVLEELSCGFPEGTLSVSDISKIKRLRILSINGPISDDNLDLSLNDSLKIVSFDKTNLDNIQMTGLQALASITVNNCDKIKNIYLLNNSKLKLLVFTNNSNLEASTLNDIFESLPQVSGVDNIIVLKGNKGDTNCNRYLATSKGWVFKSSI